MQKHFTILLAFPLLLGCFGGIGEAELKNDLPSEFRVGETRYFHSQSACFFAEFVLTDNPKIETEKVSKTDRKLSQIKANDVESDYVIEPGELDFFGNRTFLDLIEFFAKVDRPFDEELTDLLWDAKTCMRKNETPEQRKILNRNWQYKDDANLKTAFLRSEKLFAVILYDEAKLITFGRSSSNLF